MNFQRLVNQFPTASVCERERDGCLCVLVMGLHYTQYYNIQPPVIDMYVPKRHEYCTCREIR